MTVSPAPQSDAFRTNNAHATNGLSPTFTVRIAEISAYKPDGTQVFGQRRIPSLPQFEEPFSAFAQGTVFKARDGFIAVEDLQPGDWLTTASGQDEQVSWIGSATFSAAHDNVRTPLTRVMADSFGMNRPESCVSFGPAARLLQTPPNLRSTTVADRLMTPATSFLDGVHVIEISPPTPVRMFNVATRKHSALIANGLEVESYHPGTAPVAHLSDTLRNAFLGLFPHVEQLADFGPMRFARAPEQRDIA
jgi:hypothetical protein